MGTTKRSTAEYRHSKPKSHLFINAVISKRWEIITVSGFPTMQSFFKSVTSICFFSSILLFSRTHGSMSQMIDLMANYTEQGFRYMQPFLLKQADGYGCLCHF